MADRVIDTQEVIEVASNFNIPPKVYDTQEVVEVAYSWDLEYVYDTQEILEIAFRPFTRRYGPRVQEVG